MGQAASGLERPCTKPSSKVKQRVQLLEELVQGQSVGRRQQLLKQLTADSSTGRSQSGYFLSSAPEEFKLGCLIAAGSYGRVYAGTYCGQPAALKLLILEEESAAAILNEVRLCLKLNHKNLVRLLDCAVVSTSRQHGFSQEALEDSWLTTSAAPHTLQPSRNNPCNPQPMLALSTTATEEQQAGSLRSPSSPASAAGSSVIVRALQAQFGLLTGNDLLYHEAQQQQHLGLTTATGHACFEVWIAMELCDGGTLAEQVKQGFQYNPDTHQVDMEVLLTLSIDIARALSYMHAEHVCHGDLKSENVLLKSLDPSSLNGSMGCAASTCWGSSDECSWFSVLCSTASSSTCTHSCRRHSSDSCFSCCTKNSGNGAMSPPAAAMPGSCFPSCMGYTSPSSSISSSPVLGGVNSSSRNSGARNGSILSLSFAGLCCLAAPDACVGEDGDDECQQGGGSEAARCLCGSCSATLDDDADVRSDVQAQGSVAASGVCASGHYAPNIGSAAVAVVGEHPFSPVDSAEVACLLLAVGGSAHQQLPPVVSVDPPAQQLALVNALQAEEAGLKSWPHSKDVGDAVEEEHIAPLSLYTTAREHRRSRRLSQTALLPSLQMAIAAAAASYNMPNMPASQTYARRQSSSSSRSVVHPHCTEDVEDVCSSGSTSESMLQQQQQTPGSQAVLELASESTAAGGEQNAVAGRHETAASHCSSDTSSPCSTLLVRVPGVLGGSGSSGSMPTVVEGLAAKQQQQLGSANSGHDVYACRLPPCSRRHSYCYGASYSSHDPLGLSGLPVGTAAATVPISAAEAATAIAAAAQVMKEEWRLAPLRSSSRKRRMSCDDRLLLQHRGSLGAGFAGSLMPAGLVSCTSSGDHNPTKSAFGLVSGLGRAPAALRRGGSIGSSNEPHKGEPLSLAAARGMLTATTDAAAVSSQQRCNGGISGNGAAAARGSARRHSWTAYDVRSRDASGPWRLRSLTSLLLPQDQQQQWQQQAEEGATWLLGDAHEPEPQQMGPMQQVPSRSEQSFSACCAVSSSATAALISSSRRGRRMSAAPAVGMPVLDADGEDEYGTTSMQCLPGFGKQGSGRRARRHSWAGFGHEQMTGSAAGQSRRSALWALSSCFAPEFDGQLLENVISSDSSQASGSQTPRRSHLFHLAGCCGDGSYLPLDDAAAAGEEVQQPLLSGSCNSTDQASDMGNSCFPRRCLCSSSSAGGSRSTKASSWCCSAGAGSSVQGIIIDPSVAGNSTSMAALLPPGVIPSSTIVPVIPAHAGVGTARCGMAGRRCSWDESRSGRAAEGAAAAQAAMSLEDRELKLLGAQMQQRHQQDRGNCALPAGWSFSPVQSSAGLQCSSAANTCLNSNNYQDSDVLASNAEQVAPWAVTTSVHSPVEDSTPTTDQHGTATRILGGYAPAVTHACTASPAAAVTRVPAEEGRVGCTLPSGADIVTLDNSTAALQHSSTPPDLPRCTVTATANADVRGRRMSRRMSVLSTTSACDAPRPTEEQLSVGFNMLFGPVAAGAAEAAAMPLAAAPSGTGSDGSSGSCASLVAAPRHAGKDSEPEKLLRGETFSTWLSQAQQTQHEQQQTQRVQGQLQQAPQQPQQDEEQHQQQQPSTLAAAYAAATAAGTGGSLARVSPLQPFTGSFGLKRGESSRQNSSSSLSTGDPQCGASAATAAAPSIREPTLPLDTLPVASHQTGSISCSFGNTSTDGRARRWSTGVAAHDLIMRKQSMLPSPCSQLSSKFEGLADSGLGSRLGRGAGSTTSIRCRVSLTSPGPDGSIAMLLADVQQLDDVPTTDAAATAGASAAAAAAVSADPLRLGSLASSDPPRPGTPTGSVGTGDVSCESAVVNVLGIPNRPSVVLAQRRMSYDTATGTYMLVDKDEPGRLQQQQEHQQQQQQPKQQQPLPPVLVQPSWQPSDVANSKAQTEQVSPALLQVQQSDQQQQPCSPQEIQPCSPQELLQQQQCQAQMQRLVEALAKKGYSTSFGDSGSCPWPSSAQLQSPPQQQQQQGASHRYFSSSAAAAASVQQQQQMPTSYNSSCVPLSRPKYTAKVCDFGFSQCLRAGQSHCSTAAAGTITHQAPEVLRSGYLSPAADIYAFGIILWELLTGERPFRGLLGGDVLVGVCEHGLRPSFPPGAPAAYVALAQQCWAQDAAERPTAQQLLKRLNEMLYDSRRAKTMQQNCSSHNCAGGDSNRCRRRRHSMPVVGSTARKRRMSRRLSLFLPLFSRQPAMVPEHAPLEQQLSFAAPAGAVPADAGGVGATFTAAAPAMHVSSPPERSCSGWSGSGSLLHTTSASGHAVRLRDVKNGTVASGSGNATDTRCAVAANASGAVHGDTSAASSEMNQWFKSFDD